MTDVLTISPKYQVVIPKRMRESMGLKADQKLRVIAYGDRIELVPERSLKSMRGSLAGVETGVPREANRF